DVQTLKNKVQYFIEKFNQQLLIGLDDLEKLDYSIKWSRDLKRNAFSSAKTGLQYNPKLLVMSLWRPFMKKRFYAEFLVSDVFTKLHYAIHGQTLSQRNWIINISGGSAMKPFQVCSSNQPTDYEYVEKNQCLPLYTYSDDGTQHDNITDWSLNYFQQQYHDASITKRAIFDYVYAVLHDPRYREQFALNLKSEFPRIPIHPDFWAWSRIGGELVQLHAEFETVQPWPLKRVEQEIKTLPKCRLKANKTDGTIEIDSATTLMEIPAVAWEYQLGTRSALEWVLDQYKERTPKDSTIRAQFNTYQFADYKEQVIELLARVCRVSVATVNKMQQLAQLTWLSTH
ncbi:type ISP restriction/modification enzyme, partial [Thiospirillum jenense]